MDSLIIDEVRSVMDISNEPFYNHCSAVLDVMETITNNPTYAKSMLTALSGLVEARIKRDKSALDSAVLQVQQ